MYQTQPITHSAWTSWEGPDPSYWVPRGYVVVNADLRGYGHSGGKGNLLTEGEGWDYYDLIDWAARQQWSTGRIGLNGVSYLAISQWRAASLRPPSLAAICPWEGFTDAYRELARPGGIRERGFFTMWGNTVLKKSMPTNLWRKIGESSARDDWWRSLVPDLAAIDVPALICASFSDQSLHTGGSFHGFTHIASAQKWLYTHRAPKWATYYSPDALALQKRFFDHFLKFDANGFENTPRVRVEVRESRMQVHRVVETTAWPPDDIAPQPLYLRSDGTLQLEAQADCQNVSFDLGKGRLTFEWAVPYDLELIGRMKLRLLLDVVGTNDPCLFVGIRKFHDGRETPFEGSYGFPMDMVTKGWRRVAYRDDAQTDLLAWEALANFDVSKVVEPNETVQVNVPLLPSATFFKCGDILRLDIQGRWFWPFSPLRGQFPARYERSPPGTCRLHLGGETGAALIIPLVSSSVPLT